MLRLLISPYFIWLSIIGVFLTHTLALLYFGYWKLPWLDLVLHFSGGLVAASVFFNLSDRFPELASFRRNRLVTLILVIAFVALVGVLWEFFEFGLDQFFGFRDIRWQFQDSIADTMTDLFMDLLGALALFSLLILGNAGLTLKNPTR